MEKLRKILKIALQLINALFWITSPLAIIMFFFGGFISIINGLSHREMVRRLDTEGVVEVGFVDFYDEETRTLFFDRTEDGSEYFGTMKTWCYPDEVINSLHEGEPVMIRYVPGRIEDLALEEYMHHYRNCPGVDPTMLYILGVCIVWVIIYPDFLYFGYIDDAEFQLMPEWNK
jgi:hypothetical protein